MSTIRIIENTPGRIEVCVDNPSGEDGANQLRFIFTPEGQVVDSIVNDEVDLSYSATYGEVEEHLYNP